MNGLILFFTLLYNSSLDRSHEKDDRSDSLFFTLLHTSSVDRSHEKDERSEPLLDFAAHLISPSLGHLGSYSFS